MSTEPSGTPAGVVVTLPADAQQVDETGYVWTFLDESPSPDRVWPGALVVAGDSEDPFIARVVDIVDRPGGRKVHLEVVGFPEQVIDELRHCGLVHD